MKRLTLTALTALMLATGLSSCATQSSDNGPQPVRPPGSGGRGMSPGQEAETSRGTASSAQR